MLLLTTAALPQLEQERKAAPELAPYLGRLVQPRHWPRCGETATAGIPWAADNDAFGGFDAENERLFAMMLDGLAGLAGCLFVVAPDVVGDWHATERLWGRWAPEIKARGLPAACVAQEGLTAGGIPPDADALFIGGREDAYKLGADVRDLVREARAGGLHVHMGRVNSRRRIHYAASIGCLSFDGTSFSRWRTRWLREGLGWAREAAATPALPL